MSEPSSLRVREYGTAGPSVIVLHGGPAAAGEAAPIARGLAARFRVLEPWQRGSGAERLTVARHVDDLENLIRSRLRGERPAVVGESWGAMLALAHAAAFPESALAVVLVGCGTFDLASRERMRAILADRMDADTRRAIQAIDEGIADPGERMIRKYERIEHLYHWEPLPLETDAELPTTIDLRAHTETWDDMLRQQSEGVYPAAFAAIQCPVLMIHGDHDPHPGGMIRDSLERFVPQLEYRELRHCGHCPWRERRAREEFFRILAAWLLERARPEGS